MTDEKELHEEEVDLQVQEGIREKIVHLLSIYPLISPTMLQGALGPQVKAAIWRPVLTMMIEDGTIIEEAQGLQNTYQTTQYICEVEAG